MAILHYHRWSEQFIEFGFSSEYSMRDYLFSNPTLIFEEETWIIPIVEEKCLPQSSLGKKYGRVDIILCRIIKDKKQVKDEKKLCLSDIELWIVELKNKEASYENGFRQLLGYMVKIKNNKRIQSNIIKTITNKVEEELKIKGLKFEEDEPLGIRGSLVAPSFDLIGKTRDPISENVESDKNYYKDLYDILGKIEEDFTLMDVRDAAHKLSYYISLIKLTRFKRGDEIIIYSENILGRKAAAQIARVDPIELFENNTIKEGDIFHFIDDKDKVHEEVKCKVLEKRGPSHSFIIKIEKVNGHSKISVPKWSKDKNRYEYNKQKLPIENTAKICSIALHKLFKIYKEDELSKYYQHLGEGNFIRGKDKKRLGELREEQRLKK